MNVTQPIRIRFQLARRVRAATGLGPEPVGTHKVFVLVTDPVLRRGSCSAGVFPFGFGRESIPCAVERCDRFAGAGVEKFQLFLLAQLRTEFGGIVPAHRFHWMAGGLHAGDGLFLGPHRSKAGGIDAHDLFVFRLSDFVDAQVDRLRQDDLVLRRFALHAFLPAPVSELKLEGLFNLLLRAAHREFARRDKSELHADGVGVLDRHVEVLGPRLLVFLRLLGIKWRNRRRWCLGRPTMPANEN